MFTAYCAVCTYHEKYKKLNHTMISVNKNISIVCFFNRSRNVSRRTDVNSIRLFALQLQLECPDDCLSFQFCPSDPNIIAGGCMNGQVHNYFRNLLFPFLASLALTVPSFYCKFHLLCICFDCFMIILKDME